MFQMLRVESSGFESAPPVFVEVERAMPCVAFRMEESFALFCREEIKFPKGCGKDEKKWERRFRKTKKEPETPVGVSGSFFP